MPPFFGPVSSFLSLKSNIGTGLVFGGQVTVDHPEFPKSSVPRKPLVLPPNWFGMPQGPEQRDFILKQRPEGFYCVIGHWLCTDRHGVPGPEILKSSEPVDPRPGRNGDAEFGAFEEYSKAEVKQVVIKPKRPPRGSSK
jgi:hypothetical protein